MYLLPASNIINSWSVFVYLFAPLISLPFPPDNLEAAPEIIKFNQ